VGKARFIQKDKRLPYLLVGLKLLAKGRPLFGMSLWVA